MTVKRFTVSLALLEDTHVRVLLWHYHEDNQQVKFPKRESVAQSCGP